VVNACRMSKSELPRSIFAWATESGVLRKLNASVEALSIECEKLYEASACRPRDKRRGNLTWIA
jgi:hypothetical protein